MATNARKYMDFQKFTTKAKFLIISIIISLITTIIIYLINTYWYQESKVNSNERNSNFLVKSIRDIKAYNINDYIGKVTDLLNKTNAPVSIKIFSKQNNNKQYSIENKKMSEYKNNNYFIDSKLLHMSLSAQSYTIDYIYKKRLGNNLLYDTFDALTFSARTDMQTIKKYNLHQKSFVFYSYFIVVFLGLYLASYIYEKMKRKLNMQDKELSELIIRHKEKTFQQKLEKQTKEQLSINSNHEFTETKIEKIEKINDKEHIRELKESILHAKDALYILSGWISTTVLDIHTIYLLEEAIKRRVNVYIGFGYGSKAGECKSLRLLPPEQHKALMELFKLKNTYNQNTNMGSLYLGLFPTHQKILLKDNEFVICGSNNWLSNRYFNNHELSLKVYSSDIVNTEKLRIESLIEQYSINDCYGTVL